MSRHSSQERIDRIIAVLRVDPELSNAQLHERFGAWSALISRARLAAGVPAPDSPRGALLTREEHRKLVGATSRQRLRFGAGGFR